MAQAYTLICDPLSLGTESIIQIEELVRKEVAMTQVHHDGYANYLETSFMIGPCTKKMI
jgi:hypothetical protein